MEERIYTVCPKHTAGISGETMFRKTGGYYQPAYIVEGGEPRVEMIPAGYPAYVKADDYINLSKRLSDLERLAVDVVGMYSANHHELDASVKALADALKEKP